MYMTDSFSLFLNKGKKYVSVSVMVMIIMILIMMLIITQIINRIE